MNQTSFIDTSNFGIASGPPIETTQGFSHVEEIPSTGFNQIFHAERFGKRWFLKGLKEEYRKQPFYTELLKKELDISLSLDHPNIVKTFGWEQLPEVGPCIVMEYVDGETLKEKIEKGIPPSSKLRIIYQLLDAVSYFHSKQIVHRDLKPSNIIITHNGCNVKVIDFGLADTDSYCILKQPAGTLRYTSPEQQAGQRLDVKNDIYSIGRILEDMHLGWRYKAVIQRCLQPVSQRYENTTELLAALQNAQKRTFRRVSFGTVLLLVALLAYLSWQVFAIRNRIPKQQEVTNIANPLSEYPYYFYRTPLPLVLTPSNAKMVQAIQMGLDEVNDYIKSTQLDMHFDTLSNIQYLDNTKYTHTVQNITQMVNQYCEGIKVGFTSQENKDIHAYINYRISERYFYKWTMKLVAVSTNYNKDNQTCANEQ